MPAWSTFTDEDPLTIRQASASSAPAATRPQEWGWSVELEAGQDGGLHRRSDPTVAHIRDAWIMGYDLFPMETLAFKKRLIREAIDREH